LLQGPEAVVVSTTVASDERHPHGKIHSQCRRTTDWLEFVVFATAVGTHRKYPRPHLHKRLMSFYARQAADWRCSVELYWRRAEEHERGMLLNSHSMQTWESSWW